MKILIVSDFYSPGNSRLLEVYGKELSQRGHRVGLLAGTGEPSSNARRLESDGIHPFLFESSADQSTVSRFLARMKAPLDQYEEASSLLGKPDVVLFNQPLTALPLLLNHSFSATVYVHHGPWAREWSVHFPESSGAIKRILAKPYRMFHRTVRGRLEEWILDRMDRVVVLSEYMRQQVQANHPHLSTPTPVIVPGGVDPERFRPGDRDNARKKLGWRNETVIFTLRRLVHRMGVDRLIEAFGQLHETSDDRTLRLVIGGTGPEREALEDQANQLEGVPVDFEGFVEDERLPEYYRAADLFVLPTRELEGFGLVTLEALASGTPVVATRTGGTREILSDLDPELFLPDYTPRAWAGHLEKIIDSDRLSTAFRHRCRKYVLENFTWSQAIDKLQALLSELTTGH